jgi:hypothetical protein
MRVGGTFCLGTDSSNTYLYGLGAIGEKTNTWNFALPDGSNTPRQLTDVQGEITLSARYTPWGDSLEIHGTGNFTFGYLGGVLDAPLDCCMLVMDSIMTRRLAGS